MVRRGLGGRADRAEQALEGALELLAPVSVVRRSIRIRGVVAWARWVLKPTLVRKSTGVTQVRTPGRPGPRVSPNASTAEIPPRSIRSRAIPCTSIRPSPPPRDPGSTYTAESRTASDDTGAVGKTPAPGRYAGGAYSA